MIRDNHMRISLTEIISQKFVCSRLLSRFVRFYIVMDHIPRLPVIILHSSERNNETNNRNSTDGKYRKHLDNLLKSTHVIVIIGLFVGNIRWKSACLLCREGIRIIAKRIIEITRHEIFGLNDGGDIYMIASLIHNYRCVIYPGIFNYI